MNSSGGKTILIVEDEYLIALDLQDMLEAQGWRVLGPAPTVKAALRLLDDELPSVALLDVNLFGQSVAPVAIVLKAKAVPFAVASAYDSPGEMSGGVLSGALNVGKPTSERLLLATLDRLLAARV